MSPSPAMDSSLRPSSPAPGKVQTVTFYSRSGNHALAYLRMIGPAQRAGLRTILGVEDGHTYPERAAEGDIVVIQRDFPSELATYEEILRIARLADKPVVLDLDDLLLELPEEHPDRRSHYYSGALLPMLQASAEVDAITVTTDRLREYLLQYNPNVIVLPNYLVDDLWRLREPAIVPSEAGRIVIGYMGGASHTPDLDMLAPVLLALDERFPNRLLFRFWGIEPPAQLAGRSNVEAHENQIVSYPAFAEYFQTQTADLFIGPLRDNLFNACKSPIKFFECSALGAPSVFSRIDPYSSLIVDGENGLLASSDEEWIAAVSRLIEGPELRLRIARNAQATIRSSWLLSDNAGRWVEAYEAVRRLQPSERPPSAPIHALIKSIAKETTADRDALLDKVRRLTAHQGETQRENEQLLQHVQALSVHAEAVSAQAQALLADNQALLADKQALAAGNQVLLAEKQALAADNQALSTHAQALSAHLSAILQSRAWRAAQALQRARAVLIPHGSLRARVLGRIASLLGVRTSSGR